jgi:hypothetical protein
MKIQFKNLLVLILFISSNKIQAQAPLIQWQNCLGGTGVEGGYLPSIVQQTTDGGYILATTTNSNDGDVSGHHDPDIYTDIWLVKLDDAGSIQWQKCIGGSGEDVAKNIKQTPDGGYILGGSTFTSSGGAYLNGYYLNGDILLDSIDAMNGGAWIAKLNSIGEIQWQKMLGGCGVSYIQPTADGGYITVQDADNLCFQPEFIPNLFPGSHGESDYWLVKLNSIGVIEWSKALGGSFEDIPNCVRQTTDGGYIIAGESWSNDGDVSGHHGSNSNTDLWIVKVNNLGNIQWQRSLGGIYNESSYFYYHTPDIQLTSEGGYIIAGENNINDGDVIGNHGNTVDAWVVKLNNTGQIEWQKSLGGFGPDGAGAIQQTSEGGYIVAGYNASSDDTLGDVRGNHGDYDYWVVKLNNLGGLDWQKSLGGTQWEFAHYVQQTTDGGFIMSGLTISDDGDVSGRHGDNRDVWLVKLTPSPAITQQNNVLYSNINLLGSNYLWYRNSVLFATTSLPYTTITDIGDYTVVINHNGDTTSSNSYRVSTITALKNNSAIVKSFMLYPNPASQQLNIQIQSKENSTIQLYIVDMNGKEMYSKNLQIAKDNNLQTIDVSHFAKGAYLLNLKDESGTATDIFVIE